MKIYIIILLAFGLFACNSATEQKSDTAKEKEELQQVDSMKKTDKEKEDSVRQYWENKMNESKVGE